jgi:hypothetical protein
MRLNAGGERSWLGTARWSARLGLRLGKLRLHAIERRQSPGREPTVAKRRRWFGSLLIPPGNLCLRLMRSGVRVLSETEWQARERALSRVLDGIELETESRGWLVFPQWTGVVLADYARCRIDPATARLQGLAAASRALRDLHRVELSRPDGGCERLSHGDATLRNVLFDPETGSARWFDFDMAHEPDLAPGWRHSDDLRALVYSAVESFADVPVALLLRTIGNAYDDPGPWEQIRHQLARGTLHRSPLHFAQACPLDARGRELEVLLLQGPWTCASLMEIDDDGPIQ